MVARERFFTPENFELLARAEPGHFWFEARKALLIDALQPLLGAPSPKRPASYLEVGSGTGFLLDAVARAFPAQRLFASDLDAAALAFVASRVASARPFMMDGRHPPLRPASFDVIGAYDVIEHIEEDAEVLRRFFELVRPGGVILLTVPQHPALWSALDEYGHHFRRYTRAELVGKAEAAGFTVERVTSFATLTLPAMLLSRLKRRDLEDCDPAAEIDIGRITNAVLAALLRIEYWLIRWRFPLPVGGSLLLTCRRPARAPE